MLQLWAGRAGRKGTEHETGLVCARNKSDHELLKTALAQSSADDPDAQARVAPLFEQVRRLVDKQTSFSSKIDIGTGLHAVLLP